MVVVGGDRQLDPLAGQGDRPLVERGVAVAAVGQGVDVRVAGDQPLGRDLAADRQVHAPGLALGHVHDTGVEPVFEPAGGGDRVATRRQADEGPAVGRVDDPGPRRQAGIRLDDERGQGAAVVDDRDPARQAGIPAGLGDADLQLRAAQGLAHGAGVEGDPLDDHVIRPRRRSDRQAVPAVAQGAGRHGQGVNQRRLHGEQLADATVVDADVPSELHVALPDQQGRLDRVGPALEPQLQAPTLGIGTGELPPFRPARRPQVVAVRVDHDLERGPRRRRRRAG